MTGKRGGAGRGAAVAMVLAGVAPVATMAEEPADTLYIDNHYHLQSFLANPTTTLPDLIETMDKHKISRSALMSVAFTAQYDPLFDGPNPTGYYLAIDWQGGL